MSACRTISASSECGTPWTRWYLIRPRASRSVSTGSTYTEPFNALADGACSTTGTSRSSTGWFEANSLTSTVSGSQVLPSTNSSRSGLVEDRYVVRPHLPALLPEHRPAGLEQHVRNLAQRVRRQLQLPAQVGPVLPVRPRAVYPEVERATARGQRLRDQPRHLTLERGRPQPGLAGTVDRAEQQPALLL